VVGRPLAEAELVEQAKRGDSAAYEALVVAYQQIAFRTAFLVTGSAADAEEAAQDAFVKAFRALGRFRSGSPFKPWLLQIVVNEARNRRRSAGRREHLALRVADEPSSGGAAPSPEAALIAAEERDRLLRAVAALGEEDRIVVSCRHFLGLSEEETAQVMALPVGTGKSRLSRALARVRARLEEDA
jgi:RNA polymerase sigma-70 factor, ECF subfamily